MSTLTKADDHFFVAGARGMVGSSIFRALEQKGYGDEVCSDALLKPTRQTLDRFDREAVKIWFRDKKLTVGVGYGED
ncbi:Possible pseudogene of GDP-L fucose synthetase [Synechococcus sp. RCC307]|nr:Possible pseudogene of GDP-L fucose synthetase [Synechococcus sp. RCC307]